MLAGWVFNAGVIMQMACHGNIPAFYIGRFVSGLGIGGTTFVIPQYLSECAPAEARGGIVGCVSHWHPIWRFSDRSHVLV